MQFCCKFTTKSVSEKKFENRLIFGEVMGKSLISCFFGLTVYICLHLDLKPIHRSECPYKIVACLSCLGRLHSFPVQNRGYVHGSIQQT